MNAKLFIIALIASSALSATFPKNCKYIYADQDKRGTGCRTCEDGFYGKVTPTPSPTNQTALLNDDNSRKCVKCSDDNCKWCNEQTCTSCKSGFYFGKDNKCTAVPTDVKNCLTFNTEGACTACETAYYVKEGKCAKKPDNCMAVSDAGLCTRCNAGFTLKTASESTMLRQNPKCVACSIPGCDSCDGDVKKCTRCKSNFFKDADVITKCTECLEGCATCSAAKTCDNCVTNHEFKDGKCSPIQCKEKDCKNCWDVYNNRQTFCLECKSSFFGLASGQTTVTDTPTITCTACGSKCSKCQNAKMCFTCSKGYALKGEKCSVDESSSSKTWIWIVLIVALVLIGAAAGFFFWKKNNEGDYSAV